ncbi:MAG: RNA polymerase sigma factor [Candidatus Margulisbacteria bacterium]|nr:RNA polymerase sigma factor [Candidatus Margulisiibacteriota bacterium]
MAKPEKYSAEFLAGDRAALERLYKDTAVLLYRVVFRMTGSREDTEDILHDVYIRAYEKRKSYRPELSDLRAWLCRIAVNHTLNTLKRRKWLGGNLARIFGRLSGGQTSDELDGCLDAETGQDLQKCLQKVPENFRVCLILRDIEDRTYEDIAALLKLKAGTVKSRINRGRRLLKAMYAKEVRTG